VPRDFAREDVDLRRAFAVPRREAEVFRARLVDRFFVVFARVIFFRRGFADVLRGRFFATGLVNRLNTFCAAGAIGSPAADLRPAIAPTAPPTAAPTGPATLPMSAPAAAPATGFEIGGTSIFSDGC